MPLIARVRCACLHDDSETVEVHAFGRAAPVATYCVACQREPRLFRWYRLTRPLPLAPGADHSPKARTSATDSMDYIEGPATWDGGGRHVVLETTEGLEYAVVDAQKPYVVVKKVPLDLDEAIRWARDLDAAAQRETVAPAGR